MADTLLQVATGQLTFMMLPHLNGSGELQVVQWTNGEIRTTLETKIFSFFPSVLQDDNVGKENDDLYIRSVCFSPDGKFIATGAEDKQIRVSCYYFFAFSTRKRRISHALILCRFGISARDVSVIV
jgi:WD40 repeat protein